MTGLNFISINARGLNTPYKRTIILDFLHKRNVDFAMIQESHLLSKDVGRFANKFYHSIANSSAATKSRGVMLVCKRNLKFNLIGSWADKEGRITIAKIYFNGTNIALISAYAPNTFDPEFYQVLTQSILDSPDYKFILGADFNAVWNSDMDRTGTSETRDQYLASRALRQWASDTDMVDIWRSVHPSLKDYSFFSGRHRSFSRLDFIFASKGLFDNINESSYIPIAWSDHKPICCSATFRPGPKKALRWRFNVSLLQDEKYKTQFLINFQEFLEFNEGSVSDPRILWESVKGFIRSNATLYASSRNKERAEKLAVLEQQLASLDASLQRKYNEKEYIQKELVKKEINAILRRHSEFIMHKTRQTYYFQSARPSHLLALRLRSDEHLADIFGVRTVDGTVQTDAKVVNSTFASFYQSLYSSEVVFVQSACDCFFSSIQLPCLSDNESAELEHAITLQECEMVLKEMNRGKSPGPDGIPPEVYHTFWPLLGPLLVDMIQFSITTGSFHRDVNSALISLLLKKGKDPMECSSYRPISLLNADIKIYAKVLARRLQKYITKLIHSDQTGFVKSRLASDNVRRLLHVIDQVQNTNLPAGVLSLDAMKAFDRLEWPFLWSLLERVGFGPSFIHMIKVLYKNPSAAVLTGRTCSPSFSVSRGSRQGCPLSPLLFALSLEPLAQAIRSSSTFSPISVKGTHHWISLYADDILLYINNPSSCMFNILATFKKYGEISGFKINWEKSALLPLTQATNMRTQDLLVPVVQHFTYLGIEIHSTTQNIIKHNFDKTLTKVIVDLERWAKLKNSFRSRVSVIKMNVLPRVNFISSMIPLSPPKQFWSKLQSAVTKYVWNGKRPRVKLNTMQRERKDGGLALPDFELYNWAFTLRPLLVWLRPNSQVSWRELEESLVGPHFLDQFLNLYPPGPRHNNFGSIISRLIQVWEKSGKLCGGSFPWDPGIPIFGNEKLQINKRPLRFTAWEEKGISVLGDIFGDNGLLSFADLCFKYNLPRTTFFFYLQLRSVLVANGVLLRRALSSPPIKKFLLVPFSLGGHVSKLYNILLHHSYKPLALDTVWKADFGDLSPDLEWSKVWEGINMSSRNPDHQQIHYNFIHRLYLTPKRLHKMKMLTDPLCKLCRLNVIGTFRHMFWDYPLVMAFWSQVAHRLSVLLGIPIPCSPGILILNDFSQIKLKVVGRRTMLAGLTAAKKMVATRWKPPHCLSIHAWSSMFLDIAYLELSIARVHRAKSEAIEAWQSLITRLTRDVCTLSTVG